MPRLESGVLKFGLFSRSTAPGGFGGLGGNQTSYPSARKYGWLSMMDYLNWVD